MGKADAEPTYDKILYYKLCQEEKDRIVAKLSVLFANEECVKIAWLFGSITRHDTVRDIDVAIHADPELSFSEYLDFNAYVELKLGLPVDMVEIAKAPSSLKERIYREGILIKGTKALQERLQRETV